MIARLLEFSIRWRMLVIVGGVVLAVAGLYSATHDAVVVPARAIQDIDGVPTVFVRVDEERFQPRPVRVGASFGDQVEIVSGLKQADAVVTEGALMLKSKLKLRVEAEEGEEKKK